MQFNICFRVVSELSRRCAGLRAINADGEKIGEKKRESSRISPKGRVYKGGKAPLFLGWD